MILYRPTQRFILYELYSKLYVVPVDLYEFTTNYASFNKAVKHTHFMVCTLQKDLPFVARGIITAPKIHFDEVGEQLSPFQCVTWEQLSQMEQAGQASVTKQILESPSVLPDALIERLGLSTDWKAFRQLTLEDFTADTASEKFLYYISLMCNSPEEATGDFSYNFCIQKHLAAGDLTTFSTRHHKKDNTIRKFVKRNYDGKIYSPIKRHRPQTKNLIPKKFLVNPTQTTIDMCRVQLESIIAQVRVPDGAYGDTKLAQRP